MHYINICYIFLILKFHNYFNEIHPIIFRIFFLMKTYIFSREYSKLPLTNKAKHRLIDWEIINVIYEIFHIETFSLQILPTAKKKLFHEWFLCEQLRAHFPNSHLIITVILARREHRVRRNPQLSKLTLQFSYIAVHIKRLRGISASVWPDSWLQSHIAETAFTWPRYGVSVENNPRSVS